MSRTCRIFLLSLLVLGNAALLAQVIITSTVVGTVTDPQGAMVPGAHRDCEQAISSKKRELDRIPHFRLLEPVVK